MQLAIVKSEVFAGQPNPLLSDGFMKISPYETQSASLIVKDIQSVEPSVDVYGPEILYPIEARHIPGEYEGRKTQWEQSLVAPYQFTQHPEAESERTNSSVFVKIKHPKAYTKRTFLNMLYVCILKEKRDIISFIFPFAQPPTPERPRREYTTSENDEMRTTARESNELPNRKRNKRPRKTQNKKRAAHLTSTRK